MRRIILVLSAAALVAAITAFSSGSAFAQEEPECTEEPPGEGGMDIWTVTCVEEEVRSEEVSRTPTIEACQVGNSPRQGTQEGDLVQTNETTYQITTTTRYQDNPSNNQLVPSTPENPNPTIEEEELFTVEGVPTFEPTGRCQPTPGPQRG